MNDRLLSHKEAQKAQEGRREVPFLRQVPAIASDSRGQNVALDLASEYKVLYV